MLGTMDGEAIYLLRLYRILELYYIVTTTSEVDTLAQATNKETTDEYYSCNDGNGEGSLVHRHELILLALHQVVRNWSIKLAVHPLIVVQLIIVNQTSQEHSSEE